MERQLISKSDTVIELTNKIKLMEINHKAMLENIHNERFKDIEERYGVLIEQLYQ